MKEALKLAREHIAGNYTVSAEEALAAIDRALAQPEQEPFGYFKPEPFGWTDCAEADEGAIALYDKPQRTWVGLTDEEIAELCRSLPATQYTTAFARAIEAKLKELNT